MVGVRAEKTQTEKQNTENQDFEDPYQTINY